jgi:hypothetical protein
MVARRNSPRSGIPLLAIRKSPVAFDLFQSGLQTLFEKAGGVRLAIDGAKKLPASFASFPQLLSRGLHEDRDATPFGQYRVTHFHYGDDIHEVLVAVLIHGDFLMRGTKHHRAKKQETSTVLLAFSLALDH